MNLPSFKEFKKWSRNGNLVALRAEIPSDLETPVSAFLKLASQEPDAFLLESAEQEERIGRYTFLGISPQAILFSRGREVFLKEGTHTRSLGSQKDVLEHMRRVMSNYRLANPAGLPNFAGGFVGFLGYENVRFFETVRLQAKQGLRVEDSVFFFVMEFVLFDHYRKTLSIVSLKETRVRPPGCLRQSYEEGIRRIRRIVRRLKAPLPPPGRSARKRQSVLRANLSALDFEKKIGRIREYIRAGDCIQVVFSQRFHLGTVKNDFDVYRALRTINPSPYMFYFRHGDLRLIGSSPELLVKKTGKMADVRPIAGTRVRGESNAEDARLEENLRRSSKEMAEHLMLVDLGRNDLGRVCEFNTVKVSDFAHIERYSHVMHLVSSVAGRLKAGRDAFDLLRATFPAGTVTGAPKIRAMEIIDELEPEKRGPYAGALGYFSFTGDMDMCLMIRTMVVTKGEAYVQAGAGVVYDSKPEREYEETINKAGALFQAVRGAGGGLNHGFGHR